MNKRAFFRKALDIISGGEFSRLRQEVRDSAADASLNAQMAQSHAYQAKDYANRAWMHANEAEMHADRAEGGR